MTIENLDGRWRLYYYKEGEKRAECPVQLENLGIKCIAASVPGNVELDLSKAGELPGDIFYGSNIFKVQEFELHEYWYEKEFDTPVDAEGRNMELVFHGVDCFAEYWLNDTKIGQSDNMFIEHRLDVTGRLKGNGLNILCVRLKSPISEAVKKEYDPSVAAMQTNWEQLWVRKAPHSYGWDIMPRVVSAGIWRSVELVAHDENEISDIYFYTRSIKGNRAHISIEFRFKAAADKLKDMEIRVEGRCGDSIFDIRKKVLFTAGSVELEIQNPRLWWPLGYGEANLYDLNVSLIHNGGIIAVHNSTVGIRTVELLREDINGSSKGQFLFKVNGVPVLCKGSNWVPADVFHSRDARKYEKLIELFYDTNCNILRCWGGNVYEDNSFFSLCDRYGIMVWQDFAMACACYPQAEEFLESMRREAASVIKKLRNHPSIILWSGDNECDWFFFDKKGMDPENNRITREVLPQAVFRYDPYRPYLASSPYYSPAVVSSNNKDMMPEQHLWGPRDYYKSRYYTETTAYFCSEIGYHGCPNISSMEKFLDKEHMWPWQGNDQWIAHCTDPLGHEGIFSYRLKLMSDQIKELFGKDADNLEDFTVASQISQAEAKKFFIEMTRIRKWRRTGIIWWNMIDGWPQFSDAVVDYYMEKKLAYYYIRRVQQPVCIMIDEPDNWHVSAVAGNDSMEAAAGEYRVWDADSGETLLEGRYHTKANENYELGKIRISHGEQRLFLIQWTAGGKTYGNHYLLGTPPFSYDRYRKWLKEIAAIDGSFDAERVGK